MKVDLAYPRNGTLKQVEVDDDRLRKTNLFDLRLGAEIEGKVFSDDFEGYVFKLTGGSDKDGFPMIQGVMANSRVHLLIKRGAVGFKAFRGRNGERRRKTLRGCIMGPDIACINVVIVKLGAKPIEGITDVSNPRRLGPKRASKIRKLFGLSPEDDVKKFVVRRKVTKAGKKDRIKAPRVQRLITPVVKKRRVRKILAAQAALRASQAKRRDFLSMIAKRRMASRQSKQARNRRQQDAKWKNLIGEFTKSGAKVPAVKAAAPKKK
jgi:small subunit ribosomal protein S6e